MGGGELLPKFSRQSALITTYALALLIDIQAVQCRSTPIRPAPTKRGPSQFKPQSLTYVTVLPRSNETESPLLRSWRVLECKGSLIERNDEFPNSSNQGRVLSNVRGLMLNVHAHSLDVNWIDNVTVILHHESNRLQSVVEAVYYCKGLIWLNRPISPIS